MQCVLAGVFGFVTGGAGGIFVGTTLADFLAPGTPTPVTILIVLTLAAFGAAGGGALGYAQCKVRE